MRTLLTALLFCTSFACFALDWQPYPKDLPQFDYSGDKLKQNWDTLTMGIKQPFPDKDFIIAMSKKYPQLQQHLLNLAAQPDAHPALKALLEHDPKPLAAAIQQAWRYHYEGKFQQSYELGMQLGAAGSTPAIYSKLMYSNFMLHSAAEKLESFNALATLAEEFLSLTPGYDFGEFGLVYAHVRILEHLKTSAALGTGFLGSTQKTLRQFTARHPENSLYPTTLGGVRAGVVERVGSMVGRISYGATEKNTIASFQQALAIEDRLPVIYNEFIVALSRINPKKHQQLIEDLSQTCLGLTAYSAEEALNQAQCNSPYSAQELVQN